STRPVELPAELQYAIESPFQKVREDAVLGLSRLLLVSRHSSTAFNALQRLAEQDDSLKVRTLANEAIAAYTAAKPPVPPIVKKEPSRGEKPNQTETERARSSGRT